MDNIFWVGTGTVLGMPERGRQWRGHASRWRAQPDTPLSCCDAIAYTSVNGVVNFIWGTTGRPDLGMGAWPPPVLPQNRPGR